MGKQHRVSFNKFAQRKGKVLELVYSDEIVDYPLRTKNQVINVFKQFHVLVERETGEYLKCVRTDNEGEYIGAFDQYCKEHGIQHEQSVPKTPQHNGLAERTEQ
ncbi:hypothetical protein LIER_23466 [Lithospermum erythrorhizon]|uniref:Integrase catalytic domain-containing protein n=1 Tax=Lithospermum erythrorhizon TaxID=34254 RepID=A0AAV3R080_LITER